MYKAIILPSAKEDIRKAAQWYNKQQNGLGLRFLAEVRDVVRFIKQNPLASIIRYNSVRTTVLYVFPFMVHYTVDETTQTVIVIAVLHTSRDPKLWKDR